MGNALRLIENGGIPKIVVPNNDAEEAQFDEDELQMDMKNIVIKRPAVEHKEEQELAKDIMNQLAPVVPVSVPAPLPLPLPVPVRLFSGSSSSSAYGIDTSDFATVDLKNPTAVLKVLQNVRHDDQPRYHTAALQAEIRWKEGKGPHEPGMQRAAQASNAINAALVTYQQLVSWAKTDFKARKDVQVQLFDKTIAGIRNALEQQKEVQRKEVQGLIDVWVAVVNRYTAILDKGLTLLGEMQEAAGVDAAVIDESTKVATALVSAIRNILKTSAAKVQQTSDPEDVLRLLRVLGNAVTDSTVSVETVLKDCVGVRPDFDEKRNQELQDALYKTQIEVNKCDAALAAVKQDLSRAVASESLDETYALKQRAQAMEARLKAAKHLQDVLQTDLKDANVQRLISRLHETCQRQATWRRATEDLAKLCAQKSEAFQAVHTASTRQEVVEEDVHRREIERLEQQFKKAVQEARRELDTQVVAAIVHFGMGEELGERGGAARNRFLSRVLLEYAMLA